MLLCQFIISVVIVKLHCFFFIFQKKIAIILIMFIGFTLYLEMVKKEKISNIFRKVMFYLLLKMCKMQFIFLSVYYNKHYNSIIKNSIMFLYFRNKVKIILFIVGA